MALITEKAMIEAMKEVLELGSTYVPVNFITFVRNTSLETGVTQIWTIESQTTVLGWVKWFGRWRKYCFFPSAQTVYEEVCLRDIANFCVISTQLHRAAKKKAKGAAA